MLIKFSGSTPREQQAVDDLHMFFSICLQGALKWLDHLQEGLQLVYQSQNFYSKDERKANRARASWQLWRRRTGDGFKCSEVAKNIFIESVQ